MTWGSLVLGAFMASRYKQDKRYAKRVDTVPWTPLACVFGSSAGVLGSATGTMRHKRIGTTVHLSFDITISNAGTAVGAQLTVTNLPFTSVSLAVGTFREVNAVGWIGFAMAFNSAKSMILGKYDNTGPIQTGYRLVGSLTYETSDP